MRRFSYKKYLLLGGALFLIVAVPATFVEGVRHCSAAFFSVLWRRVDGGVRSSEEVRLEKLEGENHQLRTELAKLRAQVHQQKHFKEVSPAVIAARVIYRDPGSWTSSIWIDVGEKTNRELGELIIEKNSPVVVGRSLVGAVDYVGERQSRVRLITDVGLKPSVRAVRGSLQNAYFLEHVKPVLHQLSVRKDLPCSQKERGEICRGLEALKRNLSAEVEGQHLAKGIVQGAGTPLWRSVNHTLRGIGFNYDFPDEYGPARKFEEALLKVGDLLVTTGMDGVFPAGLCVGEVTKVYPSREGAYTYDLEAAPTLGHLDALQTVFVIPPIGCDELDLEK